MLEAARLELHSYCALAPEGDLLERQRTLAGLVNVPELEEFLRKSGNLKKELDYVRAVCLSRGRSRRTPFALPRGVPLPSPSPSPSVCVCVCLRTLTHVLTHSFMSYRAVLCRVVSFLSLSVCVQVEDTLGSPSLIYQEPLQLLTKRVDTILAGFGLNELLAAQGKAADKKDLQGTLENMRVAKANDLLGMVRSPSFSDTNALPRNGSSECTNSSVARGGSSS